VKMVFLVWIVGGLMTLFGALTYAELAAAMPGAGGEYVYLNAAYGPFFGFIYGWTKCGWRRPHLSRHSQRILRVSGNFLPG